MKEVIIGVDGGTTAVKAVAFDLAGEIVASHHAGVPVEYGKKGEAEQDMNAIWDAVATCLREVSGIISDMKIVGIGLTGQGDGVWLVDDDGEPVRKAATWLDGRSADRVGTWQEDGRSEKLLELTGTPAFGGFFPVLYEELRESEPEAIERAATQLYCKDWIRFKLTGERLTDYTEASRTFLDVNSASGYDTSVPEALGIGEAAELLPEIRNADGKPAYVTAEAAAETGIPEGTPVGIGMIDVAVTGMGLGTVDDGETWLILGTTGFVGTLLPSASERKSNLSSILATGRGSQVLEFMAPMTGTPNLNWIREILGVEDLTWDDIEATAKESGVGSGGIVYLPYASPGGERAPFLDLNASASWQGLSLTSSRSDILRSVYEGVALSLVECIRILEVETDLVVSGGGFRSDFLCQLLADISNLDVVRQDAPEAGARGAAVLGLVSAGRFHTLKDAAEALGATTETFTPNVDNHDKYQKVMDLFLKTREAIQPLWKEMRSLRQL